jgi:hypothetical protein
MKELQSLDDLLMNEMSRRNTDFVADLIIQKPDLFEELYRLFIKNSEPLSRRAAWVVDTVTEKRPELLSVHLDHIMKLLPTFRHDGLKRHSLRMIARSPLPSGDRLGELATVCFDWLLSSKEATAVKVYSMEILYRISIIEPDLKKELADSIEYRLKEETAGFKNRGQKMLRKLNIEIDNFRKPF